MDHPPAPRHAGPQNPDINSCNRHMPIDGFAINSIASHTSLLPSPSLSAMPVRTKTTFGLAPNQPRAVIQIGVERVATLLLGG